MKPMQIVIDVRSWNVSSWSLEEIPVARSNSKMPTIERVTSMSFFEVDSASSPVVSNNHALPARPRLIKCGEGNSL